MAVRVITHCSFRDGSGSRVGWRRRSRSPGRAAWILGRRSAPADNPVSRLRDQVNEICASSPTWEIPFAKTKPWGGWQLGSILSVSDGLPFTALISGDALGQANQSLFDIPDRLKVPGCEHPVNPGNPAQYIKLNCFAFPVPSTRFGNAGRNTLVGPGLVSADASLIKNTALNRLHEGARLQFRAELFNLANRANFAAPTANNKLFDTKGAAVNFAGQITTLSTSPRQLQLALKLIW